MLIMNLCLYGSIFRMVARWPKSSLGTDSLLKSTSWGSGCRWFRLLTTTFLDKLTEKILKKCNHKEKFFPIIFKIEVIWYYTTYIYTKTSKKFLKSFSLSQFQRFLLHFFWGHLNTKLLWKPFCKFIFVHGCNIKKTSRFSFENLKKFLTCHNCCSVAGWEMK